jgi:MYXO-CTERM domain-containing protein
MLRVLLARAAAGLVAGAIALSCSHDENAKESVGSVQEAATLGGAGSGGAPANAAGEAVGGGPGAAGAGGDGSICVDALCALLGDCMHCDAGECVPYEADEHHVCRPDDGLGCDVADECDGDNFCPLENHVQPGGTPCGLAPSGVCDAPDTCNGTTSNCVDAVKPSTVVCKASAGDCDVEERCAGAKTCPTDVKADSSVVCRGAAGDCDVEERCGGGDACPTDIAQTDGAVCDDAKDRCLLDTKCAAGVCTAPTRKVCTSLEFCQTASCNGNTGECVLSNKPNNAPCDVGGDGINCTDNDICTNGRCVGTPNSSKCAKPQHLCGTYTCDPNADGSLFPDYCKMTPKALNQQCRPAGGPCGLAEVCNGSDEDCPSDGHRSAATVCQAASCAEGTAKPQINCSGAAAACPVILATDCDGYSCDGVQCKLDCQGDADCLPSHYCGQGVCEARIDAGQPCTSDIQCQSNSRCADGVCCNTACKGQCEACDVAGAEGTCTVVTGEPHGNRTPCLGDDSACRGTCAGTLRGACEFPTIQTVCQDPACDAAAGLAVEQANCDGAGHCATTDPIECAPFVCGATACRGDCATDAQCTDGSFCKAGVCTPIQKPGQKCTRDAQCASGFCTDGVCCEARCDGQCEACGSNGKCDAVTGDPKGARTACAGDADDACAGSCDGANRSSCAYPGAAVICRAAGCAAGVATVAAHCSGEGACSAAQQVTCKNGCEGAICAGDACVINGDCKEGERCIAGTCAPQGEDGNACSSSSDCDSGFCVDGVCCDRACDGQCEACDGTSKPGVCSAVSGAPHGSRPQCTSDGSACAGACDGKNALGCRYPIGTVCSPGSCTPNQDGGEAVAIVEALCGGDGRCPAPRQQACGAQGCDAGEQLCNGECADGSSCPEGEYCSAGVCVTNQPNGSACQVSQQCASAFCVDGYCCGSACDDQCAACDVPGHLGECSPVTGATHGGRQGCQGGGVCGAQCDGKRVTDCSFPDSDTSCSDPYCQSGSQVAASACDGGGQCRAGEQTACASFACDGDQCSDECATDAECTKSLQCRENRCVEPFKIDAVDEGTCGCRAPGSAPGQPGIWLALAGLALLTVRRRRGPATEALH